MTYDFAMLTSDQWSDEQFRQFLESSNISDWLKQCLLLATDLDPNDVANEAEILRTILSIRATKLTFRALSP
ncbi:MAG: hypothetical protein V7676_16430 [Parasphingorhabdus sp.]|uniref:hypothetical protein n=1 Tax=Parasphingorhabdus sp. TaxID=2709688 RepID=UPI003002D33C